MILTSKLEGLEGRKVYIVSDDNGKTIGYYQVGKARDFRVNTKKPFTNYFPRQISTGNK